MISKVLDKIVGFFVDLIEKIFLKPFKISINDFFTYILGALAIYFASDRLFEVIRVTITGEFISYWTPLKYTLILFVIVLGYTISCGSTLNISLRSPMRFFVFFSLCFYTVVLGLIAQWVNEFVWVSLMDFSNFKYIAVNMPEIIAPALGAISIILPLATARGIFNYYVGNVVDGDIDWIESFEDYKGYKLLGNSKKVKISPTYMCNAAICIDDKTGKVAIIPEKKRFEATLVEGATGTGKTSMIVEPMCAMDIERKYFFREISKQLGFSALKSGIATLDCPYSNEYLNESFSLSLLTPKKACIDDYKNYVKDMLRYTDPETKEMYYRDLGFTLVAPDNACIERVQKVAKAYSLPVNIIDPLDPNSLGINPFIGEDPAKVAAIISTVLKGMNEAEGSSSDNQFFTNVAQQAIENLAILLKLIYPRMHNGDTPSLEDMLAIFNNFDLAEEMCEILKKDPVLSEDYKSLIGYFEKNFYKPPVNIHGYEIATTYGSGRKETEKFVYGAITQLDNFLRNPGIKRVLCSRTNNINLDKALQNGEIITACTRQGALGEIHQKSFGMFVVLAFKDAVLRRPGNEDTRTPHFIYIDEFPLYVNKDTEAFFTLFRKYRCGTLITIQSLSQLTKNRSLAFFKDTIMQNTKTQIIFGDMTAEESKFWEAELGQKKKWDYRPKAVLDTSTDEGNKKQTEAYMASKTEYVPYYKAGKIVTLPFKTCIYKTKTESGKSIVGRGATDFIAQKYYQNHPCAKYDFEAFNYGSTSQNSTSNTFFSGDAASSSSVVINYHTLENEQNATEKVTYIDIDNDGINDFEVVSFEDMKKNDSK